MNKKMTTKQWNKTVLAAISGDQEAFDELCRQKTASILFICHSLLHSWQDAEDATQEILTTMHAKINTLNAPESFTVWLNKLSYNTSMSIKRKQMKERHTTTIEGYENILEEQKLESLPVELLETKESRETVMNAIRNLPDNYRMAIIFYYYNGLKTREIAEVMGTSEKAVENYLHRGRLILKSALDTPDPQKTTSAMSVILVGVFENTDLPIAAQYSVHLLESMGVAGLSSSIGIAVGAVALWKVVGGVLISGSVLFSTILLSMSGIGFSSATSAPPSKPVPYLVQNESTLSSDIDIGATVSVNSHRPVSSGLCKESTSNASPQGDLASASIRGRIYLYTPSGQESPWSVPGVTVQLIPADAPKEPVRTTKTLEGQSAGWYVFEGLQPGKYQIKIDLPEYLQLADNPDYALQSGLLSYQGRTVFEVADDMALYHSLPVAQKGNIQGKIIATQPSLQNKLGGIVARLYNEKNDLLMSTVTQEDGTYLFTAPPLLTAGWYTIEFYQQEQAALTLQNKQIQVWAEPGKSVQAEPVQAADQTLPSLQVVINNGSQGPIEDRGNAFRIVASDVGQINISWSVYNGSNIMASGTGSQPGNALQHLPSGSYLLVVTAQDEAQNQGSFDFIVELA